MALGNVAVLHEIESGHGRERLLIFAEAKIRTGHQEFVPVGARYVHAERDQAIRFRIR